MLIVLAEIELHPGTRDDFLVEFHKIVEDVRAEDGCIEYGPAIDTPTSLSAQAPLRDDLVVVVEKWRDEAALDAHLKAPHMEAYRPKVQDYVKETRLHLLTYAEA